MPFKDTRQRSTWNLTCRRMHFRNNRDLRDVRRQKEYILYTEKQEGWEPVAIRSGDVAAAAAAVAVDDVLS